MIRAATCVLLLLLAACAHVPQVPPEMERHRHQCPPRRVVLVLCVFASCRDFMQPQEPVQKKTPPDGGAE